MAKPIGSMEKPKVCVQHAVVGTEDHQLAGLVGRYQ